MAYARSWEMGTSLSATECMVLMWHNISFDDNLFSALVVECKLTLYRPCEKCLNLTVWWCPRTAGAGGNEKWQHQTNDAYNNADVSKSRSNLLETFQNKPEKARFIWNCQ